MWRPDNIIVPGPGQESVWDYPRPPAAEPDSRLVTVNSGGVQIGHTERAVRILETSHPPAFYFPPQDVRLQYLERSGKATLCEFKGQAEYFHIRVQDHFVENAAWRYPDPMPGFESIAGFYAFYPGKMDACTVDGQVVLAQAGDFYGGWITPEIVGPFKGGPGSMSW